MVGRFMESKFEEPTISKWLVAGAAAGAATTVIGEYKQYVKSWIVYIPRVLGIMFVIFLIIHISTFNCEIFYPLTLTHTHTYALTLTLTHWHTHCFRMSVREGHGISSHSKTRVPASYP